MATPSRDSDPKPVPNNSNVVFIDTNLDTHLATIVSDHDTVSDLKKRILSEHPLCFPKVGQIQIHAIKVKRKEYFYHLSDSMLVKSAFHGFIKSWFLSVDASTVGEHGQNKQVCSAGSPNQVACLANANNALIGPVDIAINRGKEECPFVTPAVSKHNQNEVGKNLETCAASFGTNDTRFPLPGSIPETHGNCFVNHELPHLQIECEVDGSSNGVKDDRNVCEEVSLVSSANAKKGKRRKRKKEGIVEDNASKEKIASDDNLLSFASKKVSSYNNFEVPQLENKQDEIKEIPFVSSHDSEHTGKKLVNNLKMGVKSSGNNDPGIPLNDSTKKRQDHHCLKHEFLNPRVGCEVDGSSKGVKDDPGNIALITNPSENADKEVNEAEVSKEHQHTECNNNNTTNDIVTESMKETSEALHAANKNHRKRKRSLTNDCEEMLKVETTSQKVEAQKSNEACQENKESKDQFKSNDDISRDGVEYNHKKVTEVVSDMKPPAKKKQKGKNKSGNKSLSNKNLSVISDFSVDNISHKLLEVKQMIINSSADQSAEHFNNTDPLRTIEHGGRMKGKTNSSNSHEKPVVTSSGKDDEADRSIIQGSVQEEISEDGRSSKGVSLSKTTLENMKIGIDACKEGSPSKLKKTGNYKNHCVIDMKGHPSDGNEPKELPEDNVNFVLECDHKSEARQVEGSEEAREVLPQIDPNPMLVEECTPSNQDNADANIRGLNMTSRVYVNGMAEPVKSEKKRKKRKSKDSPSNQDNADANIRGLNMTSRVDVNGMAEPVKSEKKKRKKRKSKDSNGGPTLMEGISPVGASESNAIFSKSLNSITCDPASGNIETEENPLNHTEGKIIQQEEMKGSVSSGTGQEDDVRTDNSGSMEQIKTKADAEQVDKRQRIKPSNNKNSAFKSVSDLLTKYDVHDSKKPAPSSDSLICATRSGKITKKSKSASPKSPNKSSETNLYPAKHSVEREHSDSRFVPASNGSSQFPSNTPKGSYNLEDATAKDSTHSPVKQDDNNLEKTLKPHKINSEQQILSQQLQHEANMSHVLVDKINGSDREDLDLMNGQNAHKPEETKGKTHADSLSSTLKLSSKVGHGVLKIHPDKKVRTVHEAGRRAKLSSPPNSVISSIREKRKPKVNASGKLVESEKHREGLPISNSVLEGSNKIVQKKAQKASENNVGKVVGKTQQKKSLLAGAIFQDDSSGTSEYVHEADKSDASTRTPSDNSPMSDFSDSDSSAGSHGGKRLENGGSSALTATMSIDHILRSSSRYKKAKITASQLEGTESQPEFVLDSLNDM